MKVILTRYLGFLGHTMRRHGFENLCLTSKTKGTHERKRKTKNKISGQ